MTLISLKPIAIRLQLTFGLAMTCAPVVALQTLPEVHAGRTTASMVVGLYCAITAVIDLVREKP